MSSIKSACCFCLLICVDCLVYTVSQSSYFFIADIVIVVHHFVYAAFGTEFDNAVGCCLDELMVVRCKENVAFIGYEVIVKGLYAFQIEVVGRRVEDKTVGVAQHQASSIQKH